MRVEHVSAKGFVRGHLDAALFLELAFNREDPGHEDGRPARNTESFEYNNTCSAFGSRHRYDVVLQLVWAGDARAGVHGLEPILRRHSSRIQLATTRRLPGEGVDLSYRLMLRDPTRSDELQTELEQVPEVERLSLFVREDESEV